MLPDNQNNSPQPLNDLPQPIPQPQTALQTAQTSDASPTSLNSNATEEEPKKKMTNTLLLVVVVLIIVAAGVSFVVVNQSNNEKINNATKIQDLKNKDSDLKIDINETEDINTEPSTSSDKTAEEPSPVTRLIDPPAPDENIDTEDKSENKPEAVVLSDNEQADLYVAQGREAIKNNRIEEAKILFTLAKQYYLAAGNKVGMEDTEAQLWLLDNL